MLALEIEEIRSTIGQHIDPLDLYSCCLVSKAWNTTYTPFLWKTLKFTTPHRDLPTLTSLTRNFHHVHTLHLYIVENTPKEYLRMQGCTRLSTLVLSGRSLMFLEGKEEEVLAEAWSCLSHLIQDQAETLKSLTLTFKRVDSLLWDAIADCLNLETLALHDMVIDDGDALAFWNACSRVQSIQGYKCRFPSLVQAPSERSCQLRKVWLEKCGSGDDERHFHLPWLKRAPRLQSVTWLQEDYGDEFHVEFLKAIAEGSWPDLSRLDLDFGEYATMNGFSEAVRSLSRVEALIIRPGYGPDPFPAVEPHYQWLRVLCMTSRSTLSAVRAQLLLERCPMLEEFTAPRLRSKFILPGRPWASSNLKTLRVQITLDGVEKLGEHFRVLADASAPPPSCKGKGEKETKSQRKRREERLENGWLLERLGQLPKLEILALEAGGSKALDGKHRFLDLRLSRGLGSLVDLKCLWAVRLHHWQKLGEEDARWMVEHWPKLEKVIWQPRQKETLGAHDIFKAHRIATR